MSDIRVSVHWKNPTVFAGEDVECTITFRNVSQTRSPRCSPSPSSQSCANSSPRERWKERLPMRSAQQIGNNSQIKSPSLSSSSEARSISQKLALSPNASNGLSEVQSSLRDGIAKGQRAIKEKHRRSVSIVSIGGQTVDQAQSPRPASSFTRPTQGHARAASLQVLPIHRESELGGTTSAPMNGRAFTTPPPLYRTSTSPVDQRIGLNSLVRPDPFTGQDDSLEKAISDKWDRKSISSFNPGQVPSIDEVSASIPVLPKPPISNQTERGQSLRTTEYGNGHDRRNPATRILSSTGCIDGTPRSSGEFYSMSNNSTETLASEYKPQNSPFITNRPSNSRLGSYLTPSRTIQSEFLMMGYGQIIGSFILDGSLVDQSPFEDVRKKAIVGGHGGGGVVRNESIKQDSGIFRSLGWGNIGTSLGGLLGGNELSSINTMSSSSSNAKSVPLLSTPQSILFIDLRLAPGESKSFTYSHPLPRGLPPTHKGRAIKISYSLVVGTQRAAKRAHPYLVQHADIPFRVLPTVNSRGEVLGHDLMSPHTILSNLASINNVDDVRQNGLYRVSTHLARSTGPSLTEFLSYVDSLLEKPRESSSFGLLSPTEPIPRSLTPLADEPGTMKESIDLAILESNISTPSRHSINQFRITRSGERVAVILLARPAYRLGDTVPVAVDFGASDVPCYALHATLESSETIDPAMALRSKASIHRVTRRVHASQSECTVSAKKVLFNPIIPSTATPEFITSSISLEWSLRFEFVTRRPRGSDEKDEVPDDLLEEIARDERGGVNVAVQVLPSHSFDVMVPLRVYGAGGFDEKREAGEFPI